MEHRIGQGYRTKFIAGCYIAKIHLSMNEQINKQTNDTKNHKQQIKILSELDFLSKLETSQGTPRKCKGTLERWLRS